MLWCSAGQQVIEEQRRRLLALKQRAVLEAQCQWEALRGFQAPLAAAPSAQYPSSQCQWDGMRGSQLSTAQSSQYSSVAEGGGSPHLMHHSILHHQQYQEGGGGRPYDTLSLESSDSMDTSISTGNNSACSPDNMSRWGRMHTRTHTHQHKQTCRYGDKKRC